MDKIFTGNDRAKELGFTSFRSMTNNILMKTKEMTLPNEYADEFPVYARIDFGRWLVDCDNCNGHAYAEPTDGFFFCTGCKNAVVNGKLRHVIFPDNMQAIENELLKRESIKPKGLQPTQASIMATGLPRSWNVGETLKDIQGQRESLEPSILQALEEDSKIQKVKKLLEHYNPEQIETLLKDL